MSTDAVPLVERISVLGAGTMGHGVAQAAAQAGYQTALYDIEQHLLDAGLARIETNLAAGIKRGKLDEAARDRTLALMRTTTQIEEAAAADLVIEAVPERMLVKQLVFEELSRFAPEGCIFASNTSSLSIGEIATATDRPERCLGMHFFNPAHVMKLLELVVHAETSEETLAAARCVGESMGKTSIVVRDVPGFASSRLGVLLGMEAIRMLEQGVASAADIDTAMVLGYRHPMGPLKLTDLVGLDVRLGIADHLHEKLGSDAFEPPQLLRDMVAEGKLGQKSGSGFYEWVEDGE